MRWLTVLVAGLLVLTICPGAGAQNVAGMTQRVSVGIGGVNPNGPSRESILSADGRYVAFTSEASNLIRGDTNRAEDVFLRDRLAGTTERVSVGRVGEQGNADSGIPSLSADGRVIAFISDASNLVLSDTNHWWDVFIRDRAAGTTERVSIGDGEEQADAPGTVPVVAMSADGRYIAFSSDASNLVSGDTNEENDVFVRDRAAGTTERVSVANDGAESDVGVSEVDTLAVSADGRYVAFASDASNLVPGDTNESTDVFVRDRVAGTTERVSVTSDGRQGEGQRFIGGAYYPALSADGRYVAFESAFSNLAPGDTDDPRDNLFSGDVFVRDRVAGTTERVSVATSGKEDEGASGPPVLSADGRYVAFSWRNSDDLMRPSPYRGPNDTSHLVPGDTNRAKDVFVRDRVMGTTERVSLERGGEQGNADSESPTLSADGRYVAFASMASNLVPGDTNDVWDVFLHDRVLANTRAKAGKLTLQPNPPQSGRALRVTMPITAGGRPVTSATITCVANIGGRTLQVTSRGYRTGTARCVWRLPATSKGKTIRGSVRAATRNGPVARSFHARIG